MRNLEALVSISTPPTGRSLPILFFHLLGCKSLKLKIAPSGNSDWTIPRHHQQKPCRCVWLRHEDEAGEEDEKDEKRRRRHAADAGKEAGKCWYMYVTFVTNTDRCYGTRAFDSTKPGTTDLARPFVRTLTARVA